MNRLFRLGLFHQFAIGLAVVYLFGVALAVAQDLKDPNETFRRSRFVPKDAQPLTNSGQSVVPMIREGKKVKWAGQFQTTDQRVVFVPDDLKKSIYVLENLSLERVAYVLKQSKNQHRWSIEGEITEYQGRNYLLLKRAVLKSRSFQSTQAL